MSESIMLMKTCKIIAISGRPATGKTSVCSDLITKLRETFPNNNIIFLDSNTLLSESSQEYNSIPLEHKHEIEKLKNSGKLKYHLNPNIMANLLNLFVANHQLSECKNVIIYYRGPQSVDVASILEFKPDLYIYLDAPKEDLIERVCKRRVDLITGKTYHMTWDADFIKQNSKSLKLSQRIGDSEELFVPRIERSDQHLLPVLQYYQNIPSIHVEVINSDKDSPRQLVFQHAYNSCLKILKS